MSTLIEEAKKRWGEQNARKQIAERAERDAQAALENAQREREDAEHNLPALERAAAAVVKQQESAVSGRLKVAEQHLHEGVRLAKLGVQPPHEARKLARSWLLGGTAREDGMRLVAQLAALDPAIGHFNAALQHVDSTIEQIEELQVGAHLVGALDTISVDAWRALVRRLRELAGEDVT